MAQQKKIIARLVLQGISILGILLGFFCFLRAISLIFSIQRDDLNDIFFSPIFSVIMLVLASFLIYPSYLMLRGKSFAVVKGFSALLALISFILATRFVLFFSTTLDIEKKGRLIEFIVLLAPLLILVLVYRISVKLLERLKQDAYGPEKISETQHSTDDSGPDGSMKG